LKENQKREEEVINRNKRKTKRKGCGVGDNEATTYPLFAKDIHLRG